MAALTLFSVPSTTGPATVPHCGVLWMPHPTEVEAPLDTVSPGWPHPGSAMKGHVRPASRASLTSVNASNPDRGALLVRRWLHQ